MYDPLYKMENIKNWLIEIESNNLTLKCNESLFDSVSFVLTFMKLGTLPACCLAPLNKS